MTEECVWFDLAREPAVESFPAASPGEVCVSLHHWANEWPLGELRAVAPLAEICSGQVELGATPARFLGLFAFEEVDHNGVVTFQGTERIIVVPEPAGALLAGLVLLAVLRRWRC